MLAFVLVAGHAGAQVARTATAELSACIRDPGCHETQVVGHRGFGTGAPANSRQAVTAAMASGLRVVEVDVRQSSDGEWFLFHDGRLATSTTGTGRIEDLPARAVEAARLQNGEPVPRLAEIYELARGRVLLVLDIKSDATQVERVADWIAAQGGFDDVLLFLNTHEEMIGAARAKRRHPRLLLMVRLLDTRITLETTRSLMGGLPDVLHTDRVGRDEVVRLHGLGAKVWMNAIELEKYLPPFRAFVLDRMLQARPDFVLSIDPVAMMRRVAGR